MSRWRRDRSGPALVLGIDRERACGQAASFLLHDAPGSAVKAALGSATGGVDIVAGNDLALHWVQSPPKSVASLKELQLVAHARCVHLYGAGAKGWRIAGDWNAERPFVCAALPEALLAPVEAELEPAGIRVRWHTAWSALCRGKASEITDNGWTALRTPDRVVLWHCTQGHVDSLNSWSIAADADEAHVRASALFQVRLACSRSGFPLEEPRCIDGRPGPDATEASTALSFGTLPGALPA